MWWRAKNSAGQNGKATIAGASTVRIRFRLIQQFLLTLLAVCNTLLTTQAHAGPGELTVVSLSAIKPAVTAALARFQTETGFTVSVSFVNSNQIKTKVQGADHPDLVIATDETLTQLEQASVLAVDSRMPLAKVGMGIAQRRGAATAVDVGTAQTLKQTLLASRSVSVADPDENAAGQLALALLQQLAISDVMKPKTQLASGGNPLSAVAFGEAEIGLHPINDIAAAAGVQLAGPVPDSLQQWTRYSVALVANAPNTSEAKQLLAFLLGASGQAVFAAGGFSTVR